MKIKTIAMSGFKSFVDPTALRFSQGITCVVGPNGCGKSNVVDAIRWVMGEQSAKNLRGRSMEDVIFNGTEARGPAPFSEVTLTFDNSDHSAPADYNEYEEISITRRLDRDGNSEYLINKTPVRLLDVTNLFLGTGVGRRSAYSIVEQGRIGVIVSAKPEDRRYLIEEAAGITKFKAKKQAAERRMEYTRQNLLRVSDIISEIQRTLSALQRQAQKAERYKKYKTEIRDLELWVASQRWLELTAQQSSLTAQMDQLSARIEGSQAALQVREAEIEAARLGLQELENDLERDQMHAYESDNAVKLLESEIQHHHEQLESLGAREVACTQEVEGLGTRRDELRAERDRLTAELDGLREVQAAEDDALARELAELERRRTSAEQAEQVLARARERVADAERRLAAADAALGGLAMRRQDQEDRLARIETELEELADKQSELHEEAGALKARLQGLRGDREQIGRERGDLEQELESLRNDIAQSDVEVEDTHARLAAKRSRLHSLEEIRRRFEGVRDGVRAVMTGFATEQQGVLGLVADRFECPPELTGALAAALGERLQYVVVDDLATGVEAAGYLSRGKLGRATLIPKRPAGNNSSSEALSGAGVVGRLVELVRFGSEDRDLASHLLGDVWVVEDLATARALYQAGSGRALVTRAGELLGPDGSLAGGDGEDPGRHLIEVKREMKQLAEESTALDEEVKAARAKHAAIRSAIAERQAAIETARTGAHEHELALVRAERDLKGAEEAATEAAQRTDALRNEREALAASLEGGSGDETSVREDRAEASRSRIEAQEAVAAAEDVTRQRRTAVEEQNTVVTELRVKAAEARQKVEGGSAVAERIDGTLGEVDERETRLREDIADFGRQQQELTLRIENDRKTLADRVAAAVAAADRVAERKAEHDADRATLGELEAAMRDMRQAIDVEVKQANGLALTEREQALALEHLIDGVHERYRVDLAGVIADYHDRDVPDEATHARVEELQRIIERMGEINLTAIEDYEERSQRHTYLTAQREDLQRALSQLDKAIRQMNRKSRKMFLETFEAVNTHFKRTFPRLFGGGRAELRLTQPEDMLETGIEIVAQPPGKKLTSMELMSGGEKALTAVALIFALFQYRPSVFCLLDEVDAPLDEVNIGRFCDMVREMCERSRFIVITHSKRTMELADRLYGVTMETPGVSKVVSVELTEVDEDGRLRSDAA